jgi:prolyl-tRNA synthetase
VDTFTIEAMMQDRKALQAGTSHFLGQNFARASQIRFQNQGSQEEYAWTTSWGSSTRLIGGLIMTHGDDDGIVLPPMVAPAHIVLLPIFKNEAETPTVMDYVESLARELRDQSYGGRSIGVEIDDRDTGGARGWEWIRKGIPLRVEIGPRDIAKNAVFFARRDRGHREKTSMERSRFVSEISGLLAEIQESLFEKARMFREAHTREIDDKKSFYDFFTPGGDSEFEIHGGFARSHWCGSDDCEGRIKDELGVTIRCIPIGEPPEAGRCIGCGDPSDQRVVFAKAY